MKNNTGFRHLQVWWAGLWAAAACIGSAQAQQVGNYAGTTADGHQVSFDVALDVDTGQYYISGASAGFIFQCPKTDTSNEWGLGVFGFDPPVIDGHADLLVRDSTFYLDASLDFKSDNKIVGKIRGGLPEYADDRVPPKSGQACNSEKLKFTAEFSAVESRHVPAAAHQVTARVDRNGRRVVEHSSAR